MYATFWNYFFRKYIKWERKGNFKLILYVARAIGRSSSVGETHMYD